jgi:hypothetical protein
MALKSTRVFLHEGKEYPFLRAQLSLNTTLTETSSPEAVDAAVAATLTPYRFGEDGPELLHPYTRSVVLSNAFVAAQYDPAVAEFLRAIEAAAQAFIVAKEL